eukprot:8255-Heterococcus_DN1.PRE.1
MLFHRYKADAQCAEIFEAIDKRTQCEVRTAFYDAVKQAVDLTPSSALTASTGSVRSTSSRTSRRRSSSSDSRYDHWVCALTDGADNSSVHTVKTVLPVLRSSSCNAVFITVGSLQSAKSINQLADCAQRNGRVGLHISATSDSKGISEAFGQYSSIIPSAAATKLCVVGASTGNSMRSVTTATIVGTATCKQALQSSSAATNTFAIVYVALSFSRLVGAFSSFFATC